MLVRQARGVHISVVRLSNADARVVRRDTGEQVALFDAAGAKLPLCARIGAQLIVLKRQLDLACKGFGNVQFAVVINPRRVERKASGALIAVSSNGRITGKRHRSASIHGVSTRVRIFVSTCAHGIGIGYIRIVKRTCRAFSNRDCARHDHILRIVRSRNLRVHRLNDTVVERDIRIVDDNIARMCVLVCILNPKALTPDRLLPVVVKRAVIKHDLGTEPTAHNAQCAGAVVTVALEGAVVKGYV